MNIIDFVNREFLAQKKMKSGQGKTRIVHIRIRQSVEKPFAAVTSSTVSFGCDFIHLMSSISFLCSNLKKHLFT
jgi:hypothetical protein